jgi:hypothetical protein
LDLIGYTGNREVFIGSILTDKPKKYCVHVFYAIGIHSSVGDHFLYDIDIKNYFNSFLEYTFFSTSVCGSTLLHLLIFEISKPTPNESKRRSKIA